MENCENSTNARHTYAVTLQVYEQMDELCRHCHQPCDLFQYNMITDVIKPFHVTRLKILISNNFVESTTEVASYNLVMLVGDIGGTVGFFLGMCMLNVLNIGTYFLLWFSGKHHK